MHRLRGTAPQPQEPMPRRKADRMPVKRTDQKEAERKVWELELLTRRKLEGLGQGGEARAFEPLGTGHSKQSIEKPIGLMGFEYGDPRSFQFSFWFASKATPTNLPQKAHTPSLSLRDFPERDLENPPGTHWQGPFSSSESAASG